MDKLKKTLSRLFLNIASPFYKGVLIGSSTSVIVAITLFITGLITPLREAVSLIVNQYGLASLLSICFILALSSGFIHVNIYYWLETSTSSTNEYREYLLKELKEDNLKNPAEDAPETENVTSGKNEKKDIIALMLKNNDEINEYFRISKSQAKSSFWFSVISCIVGMAALGIAIYGIVILKNIAVSVINLVSGSISELISGTIFWVHNKSALQLNHYYNALHENEKFLSAINIADKLSDEKREEVLIEIIQKQISKGSSSD